MFQPLKKLSESLRNHARHDAETEALNQAVDLYEVEMIHRRFARQQKRRPGF